jgi:hypothetical protein
VRPDQNDAAIQLASQTIQITSITVFGVRVTLKPQRHPAFAKK